jgi:hypothetical protein
MIIQVRCNACKGVVKLDDQRTTGCLCDSDAPTWVGLSPAGKLIHYSQVDLTILQGKAP